MRAGILRLAGLVTAQTARIVVAFILTCAIVAPRIAAAQWRVQTVQPVDWHTTSTTLETAYKTHWVAGGIVGFVVGAATTSIVLHSGGSTSLCDRSANQDAMSSSECLGVTLLGGVAGAAIGAIIGHQFRSPKTARELRILPGANGNVRLQLVVPPPHVVLTDAARGHSPTAR